MTAFDKTKISRFRFVHCDFAADTGVARLVYAFDDGPEMVETITVPGAPFVLDEARAAAAKIAGQSILAVMANKELVNAAFETTLAQGVVFERRLFHSLFAFDDQKEGMAAFVEKRKPAFTGR